MQMTVGTVAQALSTAEFSDRYQSGQIVVLQNLGPGNVYTDFTSAVTMGTGLRLQPGDVYEFPRTSNEQEIYLVASAAGTDVRVILVD